jgi:hypothetical protein
MADFGLSKFKDYNTVSASIFMGCTPSYEPPEARNSNPQDFSDTLVGRGADIWAFGCILSEIATFMIYSSRGIRRYKKERFNSPGESRDESFHASTGLKEGVKEWLRVLKSGSSEDVNMQKLLGCITKIMNPNPKLRPNSEKVLEMVSGLHQDAASELISLLSGREEPILPSPPPSPSRSPPPPPVFSREVLEDLHDLRVLHPGSNQPELQVE